MNYPLAYYNLDTPYRFEIEGTPQFSAPSWVFLLWGLSVDLWIIVFMRFLLRQRRINNIKQLQ